MPTVMWEQRKIEHGFTPILVALRKVLEHFFFEFADMTVGVKHSPLAHGCLQKSESLPFYFLHLGMSNERIGVPTLWKFDNRSFGASGCGSHIRWEYAVIKGFKFFAETTKAYGWPFPASLGVKCALPNRPVLCFTGNGGFYF